MVLEDVEEGEVPTVPTPEKNPVGLGMGFCLGSFFWHILII